MMNSIAESAVESLRDAVVVVDSGLRHLPVVLANASARRCLLGSEAASLLNSSLYSWLGDATDSVMGEASMPGEGRRPAVKTVGWRLARGATQIATELKPLGAPGRRLLMLTFAEQMPPVPSYSGVEHLPLDLLMLNKQLAVTYANAGAVRTAGGRAGAMLGNSAMNVIPTSAIPREAFDRALSGVDYRHGAIAWKASDGALRWFDVAVQPLRDASGIAGVVVLSLEVTEQRSRSAVVAGSESRLLALTEHAADIIAVAGREGGLQYVSGGIRNALGYTAEERHRNSLFELIHPEEVDLVRTKYRQLVDGEITSFTQQYRARHKNGSYRWLESSYVPALHNPLVEGVVVNSRDITDRRLVESRLAQREEVFRLAADAVQGIIFEWDLAQGTVQRSRGIEEVLGLPAEQLMLPEDWRGRVHPRDMAGYADTVRNALQAERGWTATYRIRDASGQYRSMLERSLIQRSADGHPGRVIGCCVDVSEIKRLTDLLAEAQRVATLGAWEYSYVSDVLTWTDEMFRIYETTPQEFAISRDAVKARFTTESRRRLEAAAALAETTGGHLDLELEIVTFKDRRLWVRMIGHFETLDGRTLRASGSVQNVQTQKLAQIALEHSTGWLKLSMNMAQLHAWRWDRTRDTLEFAFTDEPTLHLPRVLPGVKKLLSRMNTRDRVAVRRAIDLAFASNREVREEFRLKSQGRYRSYAAVARPLFDPAGRPIGLVGVTQDITARQESEARVRRSEELLRATTSNSADTLVLLDRELRIRFINRGEPGLSIEQIIGQNFAVLLPATTRESILSKLRHVLSTAEPVTYEFDLESPGGSTRYLESRAVLVSENGMGTGISITVRNITERKRLEREILEVSSRERQTIGRDLHDGLGQELTGVALMLRGLATRIRRQCPAAVDQVNEIVTLVNQSIDTARSLAHGLLPLNTESGGLQFALRSLADRSRDVYGIPVEFQADMAAELTLSEADASHLYRIAQEALTNTARHARASAVAMLLAVTDGSFLLQIVDNGIGIRDVARPASGLGLKIMQYRASMIGARFEIRSNEPCGTVLRVTGEQPAALSALQSAHAF